MSPALFLRQCRRRLVKAVVDGESYAFCPEEEGAGLLGALEMKLADAQAYRQRLEDWLRQECLRVGISYEDLVR